MSTAHDLFVRQVTAVLVIMAVAVAVMEAVAVGLVKVRLLDSDGDHNFLIARMMVTTILSDFFEIENNGLVTEIEVHAALVAILMVAMVVVVVMTMMVVVTVMVMVVLTVVVTVVLLLGELPTTTMAVAVVMSFFGAEEGLGIREPRALVRL